MARGKRLVSIALAASLLVCGCSSGPAAPPALTIFGAASLAATMTDLETAWHASHPAIELTTSTGSSAALRTQIEQGAPADVFLSADTANPQALIDGGLANGPLTPFATNSLAVIVPADNRAAIQSAADLARPGMCIVAARAEVPITKYAELVVANLATLPGYSADFAARYDANVCSREDDVGAVVNKITLGEGDAAIVYRTDAEAGQSLRTIDIPAAVNVLATYGAVAVRASSNGTTADDFLAWLVGTDAQTILAAHGFGRAP